MLSKNKIKYIRSLQARKYRQKYHKITVEGSKVVNEVIDQDLASIEMLFASAAWLTTNADKVPAQVECVQVSMAEMSKITSFVSASAVLAVVDRIDPTADTASAKQELCLYLDAVRDPGNVGTILRIADWFGYSTVFLSPDCADPENAKCIQSSMGSFFRVCWGYASPDDPNFLDIPVFATSMQGTALDKCTPASSGLIVFGNESKGVSAAWQQIATSSINIPARWRLGAESLNVAVSAGIICAHFRMFPGVN